MVQKEELLEFLKYLKKPLDIADPKVWKPEEVKVLKSYQILAPELYNDLKKDCCLSFQDVFPIQTPEGIDEIRRQDERFEKFTLITSNIANNLHKTGKIFSAEEQWFIFFIFVSF